VKCKAEEAAYVDERGKRAHCDSCKRPGATRHIRKKRKAATANIDTAGLCDSGKKRTLTSDGPPISLASLGTSPFIAATLDADWLERQLPTRELLTDAPRGTWTAATTTELDLTTHTPREKVAISIGEQLVGDYAAMAPVMRAVAHEMGVNQTACIGANRPGNRTPRHQHAPMGVLNLLGGGKGAAKRWRLWAPGSESGAESLCFEQRAGDVLWIPPGWQHEVMTTGGVVVELDGGGEEIVTPHWVTWCLPKRLAQRSLSALLAGVTREDQVSGSRTAAQKRKLYEVLEAYAEDGAAACY